MTNFNESVQGLQDSERLIAANVARHLRPIAAAVAAPAAASNP